MAYGIPSPVTVGAERSWTTTIAGYSSASYGLKWLIGNLMVMGVTQSGGWLTATDFAGLTLGETVWELSVIDLGTQVETEVATGEIFVETPGYTTIRVQRDAADAAITKILQGGGNQTISIKGRSTGKYGLADLRGLRTELDAQLNRMLNAGNGGFVGVRFAGPGCF